MPQASNIVLPDGQATPVPHTFTVIKPQNDASASEFRDLTRVARDQQVQITELVTRAKGNATRDKVKAAIVVPILRTDAGGVTKVADYLSVRLEYTVPQLCTASEKADLIAYAKNLAAHASITAAVVDSLPQY
jgi:hypothetical protein